MSDTDPSQKRCTEEEVLQDLENRRPAYEEFCLKTSKHIEECLRDEGIQIQSIQWRVKHPDKVRTKYSDPSKSGKYNRLDDLTDIAGLRVITYYETDVDIVQRIIEKEFSIDLKHTEDKRIPDDPEKFTYHAVHLVASVTSETLGVRTSKQFAGMRCEIQITSILRHAWAEIEHKWYDLKHSFPPKAKRRFARLSALIEMADEEFVSLRNEFEESKKSIGLMVQIGDKEIPLDAQSLRAFIEQDPLVREIDQEIANILQMEIPIYEVQPEVGIFFSEGGLRNAGLLTIGNLRESLQQHRVEIAELVPRLLLPVPYRGFGVSLLASILNPGIDPSWDE